MKQHINEVKRMQQLAGIKEVEENEESIKNQILSLRKEHYALIVKMYGPDGTEIRKAAALVKHLGNQGTFDPNRKTTSPEMDKIDIENKELMKKMGGIGIKIRELYKQLEDIGLEELVKKIKKEEIARVESFINDLTNKAIEKAKSDAKTQIKNLETNVEKKHQVVVGFNNSIKNLKDKIVTYQTDYKNWLQGDKTTPPPLPPTLK